MLAAALALVLAAGLTLVLGGGIDLGGGPALPGGGAGSGAAPEGGAIADLRRIAPTVAPSTITPAPMVPRSVAPPAETVTSARPAIDPAASGPVPRIVGGPGISPGPIVHGQMQREAPPAPAPAATVVIADTGPAWRAYTQVVVIGAATLNLGGRKVVLAGVGQPEDGQRCHVSDGTKTFECSFLSMQALRQRVRARGVECRLGALETIGIEATACRIGTTDLGEWLVSQGWGTAAADAPDAYRTAEDAARCSGSGIWADAPRPDSCPPR